MTTPTPSKTNQKLNQKTESKPLNHELEHYLGDSADDVEIVNKEVKYNGFFKLSEYTLNHKLFNGQQSDNITREIFERGDAVVMMPYDPKTDSIIFNVQFRPGAVKGDGNPWLLEFVAGMFGKNESPVDVAIREAEEEANLKVEETQISKIMHYFSSPGGTNEIIHLYVACVDSRDVGGVYGLPEEGEDILVKVIPREQAMTWLSEGKVINAATIIGLQWLQMNYKHLQAQAGVSL